MTVHAIPTPASGLARLRYVNRFELVSRYRSKLIYSGAVIPRNKGHTFQQPTPPLLVSCPREISRKNIGTPAHIKKRTYGIKKEPKAQNISIILLCNFYMIKITRIKSR